MKKLLILIFCVVVGIHGLAAQRKRSNPGPSYDKELFSGLKWRNIGPFRGGRSVASTGVVDDPMTYYMGSTGGGVWKTYDAGITWKNISDGQFKTGSVGAIAVSESDPNVVYVGMGEHPARGVMTSSGDGIYKSTDAGKSWEHTGLPESRHISDIIIHPNDPDMVFVSVQGAQYGPTGERGIFKSTDGGKNWRKVLFVDKNTGASSLTMDMTNPRIIYAAMWQHRRYPWRMESGGANSGLYKSVDMGETWDKMEEGLPEEFGKAGISVSRANPERVWAVIEAEGNKGGVYRSDDAGKKWQQINSDRVNIARSWYYMEIFADPQDENVVYVLNAPVMKSIDGGVTFKPVSTPHGDNHHLWINPNDNQIMINSNDGGANVSLNGGKSWSTQQNQPTAQFYRVITDNQVPYHVYGGQQDNSAIGIASRTRDYGIDWKDWYSVAGCESAYLAFDPNDPQTIYGGCYQGIIDRWERKTGETKPIKEYPELALGNVPKDFKYRFNWNAPIVSSPHDRTTIYHAGNVVFRTTNGGISWDVISPDLTQDEEDRQGPGGGPYTNEAAGGENYNTIMYLAASPHEEGVLWAGSDDGLVHITRNEGQDWQNVTPSGMPEGIVNSIEVSPHSPGKVYITLMRYKFNDLSTYIYRTEDYGQNWTSISGIEDPYTFARVVREDPNQPGLLYAGTETGLFVSWDDGNSWQKMQLNLPVVPLNDLIIQDNDLVAATAGRSFWILDDLSALQQGEGVLSGNELKIFTPKDQYRILGNSIEQDIPGLGKNPKQGITFDYYLPEAIPDSVTITLKVFDENETLIRTYENQLPENFSSWPGGPPKPELLPGDKGINRFTWDFRRASLPAVNNVFVYGDYRGSRVAPGAYKLRLILEDDSVETTANLLPDPEIDATVLDFLEQQKFLVEVEDLLHEIHESVNQMRSAKKQLNSYRELLKDNNKAEILLDTAKSILKEVEEWERKLIQPDQKTFQDVINFHNKINAELMNLKGYADVADPEVTEGAIERLEDLKQQWKSFAVTRNKIIDEKMQQFNKMFRDLDIPAIIIE